MRSITVIALILLGLLPAAPRATPLPEDIPVPVTGQASLAGAPRPDVARFLSVRRVLPGFAMSPDGKVVSYATTTTGDPQLWAAAVGGPPRQLTFLPSSVTFQAWSPGGGFLVYGTDRAGDEREGFYAITPDGLTEVELLPPSDAYRAFGAFSRDGRALAYTSTERNGKDFDLHVLRLDAQGRPEGLPRRIHEGRGLDQVATWRPDGRAVVVTRARGEAFQDVLLVDVASGKEEVLFQPEAPAAYRGFAWTPDGRGLWVATDQDRDLAGLAFLEMATRKLRFVETPSAEVEDVVHSDDGRFLAYTVNEGGFSRLVLRDLRASREVRLEPGLPPGVYELRFAARAPALGVRISGPNVPGDLWVVDAATGRTRRATESATAGLDPARFARAEPVSFRSFDGEEIHGLLSLPAPAAGRPPVVILVHGGPTAQARPRFDALEQYLLTRGIALLHVNFRGSTGFGKRFTSLDDRRLRPDAVEDVGAALDFLARDGRVDAGRAAIMGGSYGGYLAFAAVTRFPERFRAAVSAVGVSNWVTALEGASPMLKASDLLEYGDVSDPADRAFFVELSPITHVAKVRAPLLVTHGANDPRDPVTESDTFVAAVRRQGGRVEYLRFPDEGHDVRKLSNRIILGRRVAAFLERELAPAPRP